MRLIALLFFASSLLSVNGQDWKNLPNQQEELGYVAWSRSYNESLSEAKTSGKPLFILFQEVPGCRTCKNYGNHLLKHPQIVEAIETYFVPLVIFNNKQGNDATILKKFNEPSWNNPVVRIINPKDESDLVQRLNGRYDMASLISTINAGILANHTLVPTYLDLLEKEHTVQDIRETHLAMYCFWSGEKNIGKLEGVIGTQAGFMNGGEVVKVKYDPNAIEEKTLFSYAAKNNCADGVYSNDQREIKAAKKLNIRTKTKGKFRPDTEPKYYLFNTEYRYLPMTPLQALKANSDVSERKSPDYLFSPRQLTLLKEIRKDKKLFSPSIDKDFVTSWNAILL